MSISKNLCKTEVKCGNSQSQTAAAVYKSLASTYCALQRVQCLWAADWGLWVAWESGVLGTVEGRFRVVCYWCSVVVRGVPDCALFTLQPRLLSPGPAVRGYTCSSPPIQSPQTLLFTCSHSKAVVLITTTPTIQIEVHYPTTKVHLLLHFTTPRMQFVIIKLCYTYNAFILSYCAPTLQFVLHYSYSNSNNIIHNVHWNN